MTLRLGVIRDFRAEGWPSMDLCADQLLANLPHVSGVMPFDLETPFRRRITRFPVVGKKNVAFNADRLLNRHLVLPQFLRRVANRYDHFHVADHSYAHAALVLPPGRAAVYCHDLDAFRCVFDPVKYPRPWWFCRLMRHVLAGLKAAAVVFHNSRAIGKELLDLGIVPAERLVHAPLGVAAEFTSTPAKPVRFPLDGQLDGLFALHVGSHIPRKRIDVLLDVFAAVRARLPAMKLVQVGPVWSPAFARQIDRLGIGGNVVQLRNLSREQLAELYRRAAVVLVPSEAEGFGLPVIEALACGAPVVASDIPTLREAAGPAAAFCPVADVAAWTEATARVVIDPDSVPPREVRLEHAGQFSWREHARVIGEAYLRLAG